MSWERDGMIFVWAGGPFPEPDDDELADYGYQYGRTHGSWAGYMQHVYRREKACTKCREAMRERSRSRYEQRRKGVA